MAGRNVPQKLFDVLKTNKATEFDPYVQRFVGEADSDVVMIGDLHGDVHSLNSIIKDLATKGYIDSENPFKIKEEHKKNCYIVFHGDLTDRGWYGTEAIATVCYLKCLNPNNVFIMRGNHEDVLLNEKEKCNSFVAELVAHFDKFEIRRSWYDKLRDRILGKTALSTPEVMLKKIGKFYDSLPLALFFGAKDPKTDSTNYGLHCHGGIEPGFDPHPIFNDSVEFMKLGALDPKRLTKALKLKKDKLDAILKMFTSVNSSIIDADSLEEHLANDNSVPDRNDWLPYTPTDIRTMLYNDQTGEWDIKRTIGFQWNDYCVNKSAELGQKGWFVRQGRSLTIGQTYNAAILALYSTEKHKVRYVVRAHQHVNEACPQNTEEKQCRFQDKTMCRILGVHNHDHPDHTGISRVGLKTEQQNNNVWDNAVYTLNVMPNTPYQMAGFKYASYGILKTAEKFKNWQINVHRVFPLLQGNSDS